MKYLVAVILSGILVACNSTNRIIVNNPSNLSPPIGPYSYSTRYTDLIFVSGQIGVDPVTNTLKEGIEEQTAQIFENLEVILKENGSDKNHIVKVVIYLTDKYQLEIVNKIYSTHFTTQFPARSTIVIAALPKHALIEIECIAVRKSK